jgi:hypothetical protein
MKPSFEVARLQLDVEAKRDLDRACAKLGMTRADLTAKLLDWLVREDTIVQAVVLNNLRGDSESQLAAVLSRRAVNDWEKRPGGGPGPSAAAQRRKKQAMGKAAGLRLAFITLSSFARHPEPPIDGRHVAGRRHNRLGSGARHA